MKRLLLAAILGLSIGATGAIVVNAVMEFGNNVRIVTDPNTYNKNKPFIKPVMVHGDH